MVMELVNVQADLEALRKLYGLLQNSVEDSIQELDERAKMVLKNLLDGATEKALEKHTKVLQMIEAAQSGLSTVGCNSKAKQLKIVPKLGSPSPVSTNKIPRAIQNFKKDTKFCQGCEQRGMKQQQQQQQQQQHQHQDPLGLHRFNVYTYVKENGTESGKSIRQKRINNNPTVVNRIAASSSNSVGNNNLSSKEMSDYGRDVADAIRRIEAGVLDLQSFSGQMANSRQREGKGKGKTSECSLSLGSIYDTCPLANQKPIQVVGFSSQSQIDRRPPKKPPVALKMAQQETIRVRPVASASGHKKKKKFPLRQVIVRPTLLELESDQTSVGSTQQTNSSSTDIDTGTEATSASESNERISNSSCSSFVTSRSRLNLEETDTAIGRLRRLKNKLGLIFHHHHHHHYDHDHDHNHNGIHYSKVRMWKHLQNNMFHHKKHKNEICGKQAVGKLRQRNSKRKQQQANYFHTLVQGLRSNIRQSKKSKLSLSKRGIVVKKLHCWQMFKRRPARGPKRDIRSRTIKMI